MATTTEQEWLSLLNGLPKWQPPKKRTVVISPHPDDETLGCGGLITFQRGQGVDVSVIAVTDGEGAYPDVDGLDVKRRFEQESALVQLGVDASNIVRLYLPDRHVTDDESKLAKLLLPLMDSDSLVVAPWPGDPHPDHEACGRAAAHAVLETGAEIVYYLFWTWHWSQVNSIADLPLGRLELSNEIQAARARALNCHDSQLHRADGDPILPQELLTPACRPFETFIFNA